MNVSDLIHQLQQCPQDMNVQIECDAPTEGIFTNDAEAVTVQVAYGQVVIS